MEKKITDEKKRQSEIALARKFCENIAPANYKQLEPLWEDLVKSDTFGEHMYYPGKVAVCHEIERDRKVNPPLNTKVSIEKFIDSDDTTPAMIERLDHHLSKFVDPVTHSFLSQPVLMSDRHRYNKSTIEAMIRSGRSFKSPLTKALFTEPRDVSRLHLDIPWMKEEAKWLFDHYGDDTHGWRIVAQEITPASKSLRDSITSELRLPQWEWDYHRDQSEQLDTELASLIYKKLGPNLVVLRDSDVTNKNNNPVASRLFGQSIQGDVLILAEEEKAGRSRSSDLDEDKYQMLLNALVPGDLAYVRGLDRVLHDLLVHEEKTSPRSSTSRSRSRSPARNIARARTHRSRSPPTPARMS